MTKAYAIAYLNDVDFGEAIIEYIEKIDATIAPYGGRFLVHGGKLTPAEGEWTGDLVIIEFPGSEAAAAWYASPAYQEILPLRTEHSRSIACLVEGVPDGYRAVDKIAQVLGEAS
ncbi:uncharacterized protein (DUF1330 family) [Nocardioides thalensis]|uniref:Uncharacterized protein (DUF1330 family) n=1 Tax=Nocardioides thalensis TaxID=1914755 RepID=A0A853C490_9ACTN|nr:DUF1330 domain-containing protein [Nocardioides thalensis]NYJ02545.1 uncharacterized protein (DUF1330 family) [Nocardioides thalensis]